MTPGVCLKIGGQFIGHQKDIKAIFNKQIQEFSSICPVFKNFSTANKISIIFSKSPNLGNVIVKTKLT
jgi:hypothetical protein